METIRKYKNICRALFNGASRDRSEWEGVVKKVLPELLNAADLQENVQKSPTGRDRICDHARIAVHKLASASMSYVFPMGHLWFRFGSWNPEQDDYSRQKNDTWFAEVSDIALREIERSNFYTEMASVNIDRCASGTGLLLVEMDSADDLLVLTHIPVGTFGIAHNPQKQLQSVVRKFNMTPAQLVDEFGYDKLTQAMQQDFDSEDTRYTKEHEIWHLVTPRYHVTKSKKADQDPQARPYLSVYMPADSDHILSEGGYYEMPYMATRFVTYGNMTYGASPLMNIEDTIDDLMKAEDTVTLIGQRSAMPSVVIPADMEGEVDLGAGGQTLVPIQYINSQVPREFAPPVNFQFALEQVNRLEEKINDAMYISMLQVVSNTDRFMTATEVNSREREKVMTYTSAFAQLQSDFRPLANRLFALLVRAGKINIDGAPEGLMMAQVENGVLQEYIIPPKFKFIGKMAQAMERVQSVGSQDYLSTMLQLQAASQDPRYMMNIDVLKYARGEAIKLGVPTEYMRSVDEVQEELMRLQQQQEAMAMAAQQESQAKAYRDQAVAENALMQYQQ